MYLRHTSALLCLALLPARAGAGAPEERAWLAQLAGLWDMRGTVQGTPAHYRAAGRWVLADGWLELHLTERAGAAGYEARVFIGYDAKAQQYIAHWLDRFGAAGARVVATGERHADTLELDFPYAEGAFRDTLTLAADGNSGTLLLESQAPDGAWSTFARYRLRRLAPVAAAPAAPAVVP
jgi:hypothetical protein